MCLAIPGKVVELIDAEPPFIAAIVEFGGIRRQVSIACVPEARQGDYLMVHAGVAISRVDAAEAAKVLEALELLNLGEELDSFERSEPKPQGPPDRSERTTGA